MHVEYLYYFKDFSQTLSISKTAANYYMTPQGLSRAIHQLEKDFGVTLTSYQNNAISLTPAGVELSQHVDDIINQFEEARGALAGYRLAEMGGGLDCEAVRITATSCVSQYVAALLDMQKPGLFPFAVKFKESNIYRVVPQIVSKSGEEAFGFVSIPSMAKYRDLIDDITESHNMEYQPLFVSPLVATVSVYSPLAKKKIITPRDVDGCSVARFQDAVLGDALDDFVREDSVKTVTNAAPIIYTRIIEDQAVGFAPKIVEGARILPEKMCTVDTSDFFDTEFGLLASSGVLESQRVRQVIDYIKERLLKESSSTRFTGTYEVLF